MISSMMNRLGSGRLAAALGGFGIAACMQVSAACLNLDSLVPKLTGAAAAGQFVPAVYYPGSEGALAAVHDEDEDASVVGLWQFKLAGFAVDWGTQAWHSDGTELMFSGAQDPQTGDVCQGVWRRIGHSTYTLNHIAMGWMAPGAGFGTRVHFHMVIRLDATGNSFSGTYKVGVFSVSPANPFDESVQVAGGTGTVTARRVKPD
ncbi:MAG TPA: hypothetical protein VGI91_02595 [Steroidobacteraceae bacterium]